MLTALAAILIFSLLVLVHEFGHYITAKSFGVYVHEFSIGMGPAVFKRQKGETLYSIRCLPIGGYVKLEGEDEESNSERSINNIKSWKKMIILFAGSFMNLLLGLLVSIIIVIPSQTLSTPVVSEVIENTPAKTAGLQPGDRIVRINSARIHTLADSRFEVSRHKNEEITVTVKRNNEKMYFRLKPELNEEGYYWIGYSQTPTDNNILRSIQYGYYQAAFSTKAVYLGLLDLVTGREKAEISGPIGVVSIINTAVDETKKDLSEGLISLMSLIMLISINLGIFNLLPLPALDGGRILFVLIEIIIRHKIPPEKEGFVHAIGFMLLIALMMYATYGDIVRLVAKG